MEDQILILVIMAIAGIGSLIRKAAEAEKQQKQQAQRRRHPAPENMEPGGGEIQCMYCGTTNLRDAVTCFGCGKLLQGWREDLKKPRPSAKQAPAQDIRISENSKRAVKPALHPARRQETEEESLILFDDGLTDREGDRLVQRLEDPETLRESIILKEILDPPLALRRYSKYRTW